MASTQQALCLCSAPVCAKAAHTLLDETYDVYSDSGSGRGGSQDSEVKSLALRHADRSSDPEIHVLSMQHDPDRAVFYFPGTSLWTGPC